MAKMLFTASAAVAAKGWPVASRARPSNSSQPMIATHSNPESCGDTMKAVAITIGYSQYSPAGLSAAKAQPARLMKTATTTPKRSRSPLRQAYVTTTTMKATMMKSSTATRVCPWAKRTKAIGSRNRKLRAPKTR